MIVAIFSNSPPHQACEGGRVGVARLLVAEFPDILSVRDKRDHTPSDLVSHWTEQWALILATETT